MSQIISYLTEYGILRTLRHYIILYEFVSLYSYISNSFRLERYEYLKQYVLIIIIIIIGCSLFQEQTRGTKYYVFEFNINKEERREVRDIHMVNHVYSI